MKYLYLLIFSITIISCSSKKEQSKDLLSLNLLGNVKSITENSYEAFENETKIEKGKKIFGWKSNPYSVSFNEKGFKTLKVETISDGITNIETTFKYNLKDSLITETVLDAERNLIYQTIWEYDINGYKIGEKRLNKENRILFQLNWNYNENNKLVEEKHFQSNDFVDTEYDDNGNKIESIKHEPISLSYTQTIKYDKEGRLIEKNTSNESKGDWKIKFSYKNNDNVYEKTMYNSNNILTLRWTYKYHKNGEISERTDYNISEEGEEKFIASVYYYDEKGREIGDIHYDSKNSITSQDTKVYDENGYLIENSLYTSDNTMTGILKYVYKFDFNNNWIERIEYWNDYPNTITEREIEYYD